MSDSDYVLQLGENIGYGNMMHLASCLWRDMLPDNFKGGEFVVGPCRTFTVSCECELPKDCEICCGTGWITKGVEAMQSELQALRKVAEAAKVLDQRLRPYHVAKIDLRAALAEWESNQ